MQQSRLVLSLLGIQSYASECKIEINSTDLIYLSMLTKYGQPYYSQSTCELLKRNNAGIVVSGAKFVSPEGIAVSAINFRLYDLNLWKNKKVLLVSQESLTSPYIIGGSVDRAIHGSLLGIFKSVDQQFVDSLNIQRKALNTK